MFLVLAKQSQAVSAFQHIILPRCNANIAKIRLTVKISDVLASQRPVNLIKHKILLVDSARSLIFVVDIDTGMSNVAITDHPLAPKVTLGVDVDGLKVTASFHNAGSCTG